MKKYFLILPFIWICGHLFAEGIPVDSLGNITVDYFTIKLTSDQKTKLEYSRRIQLTDDQRKILHNVWDQDEIEILDPHHRDCTCGMYYAIWIDPDEIAFLGDSTTVYDNYSETIEGQYGKYEDLYPEVYNNYLFIGVSGNIYYKNQEIEPSNLDKILKGIFKNEDDPYVIMFVAPKKGNEHWNNVLIAKQAIEDNRPRGLKAIWM